MLANRLRDVWARGESALNGWCSIPSSVTAEAMAYMGWDSLTIDMQHGPIGYDSALVMLQAISGTDVVPMVRVPWFDPGSIMKALDAGAYGIICPMVNTAAEAERLVAACRYPPAGYRSFGPTRVALRAGKQYVDDANGTILVWAMIETASALTNMREIVQVDGLDGVYVGPADLGFSLGKPPEVDSEDPGMLSVLEDIGRVARASGRAAGVHCGSVAYARRMADSGYNLVTVGSDLRFMNAAGLSIVKEFGGSA